jgi:hypothetical protein
MKANVALRASACVLNRQRASNSHSSVAKKLSHMALSYASPTEPIEGRTPASRQRWPNSIELYWADSSGRRNRIWWLTGRHGKPTLHLLTVEHAIWRRSFRLLVTQPLTSIARCLVSSRTSRRCAPVPQAASWTRPARGALPRQVGSEEWPSLSHQGMQFRSLGSGWATSEAIPNAVSSGRRLTWPISAIRQAPLPAFAK